MRLWDNNQNKDTGNGRLVRNTVQAIILKHTQRITTLSAPAKHDYQTITVDDIPDDDEIRRLIAESEKTRTVGFIS